MAVDQNNMKKFVRTFLLYFVNGVCLVFVSWQTVQCLTKYILNPQVTIVRMKDSAELLHFPAITVCGSFETIGTYSNLEMGFNPKYLKDNCGIR